MSANKSQTSSHVPYNIQYTSTKKQRDSPTSSILKTPTPIFLTTRNSSVRTRRLKFANGSEAGELLNDFREGSYDSASTTSTGEISEIQKVNYDNSVNERRYIEVAISPVKKMKVSPDSWNAFLEYQKYKDHSNETEKTDYTYSRLSKYRNKEIIPGFRIRPNLSRRPLRNGSSFESYSSIWSPEIAEHCVKRTVYETTSTSTGKLGSDFIERERNQQYHNEMSDSGARYDGYSNDETAAFDEKYHSYSSFGDDGRILRGRKGFSYDNYSLDKQSHLGNQWGYDETDDDFITSSSRDGKSSSSYSVFGRILVFLTAIYTTITHGIASTFTSFKDLFSRHILRRRTGESPYRYNYAATGGASSWKPWSQNSVYSYSQYGTRDRGRLANWWYQSFLYALYSKMVSTVSSSTNYVRSKYYRSSRRGRLLWFLIPLLLLLGLCVVLRNFLPSPDTILNLMKNSLLSVWAMTSFVFLVLFPRFVFESVPYFITVSVPYFVTTTIPNWISIAIHFVGNLSFETLSNLILDPLIYAAGFVFNSFLAIYSITSNYLLLFYSYFCVYIFKASGFVNYATAGFDYLIDLFKNAWNYLLGF